jgi:hypothetical protein
MKECIKSVKLGTIGVGTLLVDTNLQICRLNSLKKCDFENITNQKLYF